MTALGEAKGLYLRGFNGAYIKSHTGISMQSMLKQLKALGETFTKADIVAHQIEYISNYYSVDDVADAYRWIMQTFDDPYDRRRGRHIECLGCGFGDYPKVFRALLGEDRYAELRNEEWKKKQVQTVQDRYGVSNVFDKSVFDTFVAPESIAEGRRKRTQTMRERYGVDEPLQHEEFKQRALDGMRRVTKERYGTSNAMQCPDIAKKSAEHRQASMMERYGAANSVQVPEIREKIFAQRVANGTLNTSAPEDALHELLCETFGAEHVRRNEVIDERYPFHVDFYIDTLDLFIELNGDRSHHNHWYDPTDAQDRQTLDAWIENCQRCEAESGRKSRYRQLIKVWTERDPMKRETARKNGLHYLVFWDGDNRRGVPTLKDAHEWLDAGCPMPENWRAENTY